MNIYSIPVIALLLASANSFILPTTVQRSSTAVSVSRREILEFAFAGAVSTTFIAPSQIESDSSDDMVKPVANPLIEKDTDLNKMPSTPTTATSKMITNPEPEMSDWLMWIIE